MRKLTLVLIALSLGLSVIAQNSWDVYKNRDGIPVLLDKTRSRVFVHALPMLWLSSSTLRVLLFIASSVSLVSHLESIIFPYYL